MMTMKIMGDNNMVDIIQANNNSGKNGIRALWALSLRNLRIYFRDYMTIFYSLLSMFITVGLMVFFLGDANASSITSILSAFPGRDAAADEANAMLLVLVWTGGGIISINAVTVTLACFSTMIEDRRQKRLNAIYTAPVKRGIISLSYILYAWVASVLICIVTLAVFEIIAAGKGLPVFSLAVHLKLLGLICVNSWAFSALMFLLSLLVKTGGAWGAIGTVVGTLVGFFGGIYFPLGALGEGIQKVIKCVPVIYSASAFRQVMMEDIMATTFDGLPEMVSEEVSKTMGISLTVFDHTLSIGTEMLIVGLFGVVCMMVSAFVLNHQREQ